MKIEIDTQRDSKEDLAHLATMLRALSGSADRHSFVKPVVKQKNIFEDTAPSGGMMNMFGGSSSSEQASAPAPEPQQPEQSQTGDLFSIFGSSSSGSSETPAAEQDGESKTTVQDLLDDDRIVPY